MPVVSGKGNAYEIKRLVFTPPKGVKGSIFVQGRGKMCSVTDKSATKNKQIFMGENSNEKVNYNSFSVCVVCNIGDNRLRNSSIGRNAGGSLGPTGPK